MSTTAMPKITTTATSTATTTWTTPSITPPSSGQNPFIWRTSAPSGTVFIAVGAVAGFILLCFALFLITRNVLARRTARNSLALDDDSNSDSFQNGPQFEKHMYSQTDLRKSVSQGKIPLLYTQSNGNSKEASSFSVSDGSDNGYGSKPQENPFSALDATDNKRKSMFISPTAEVMGFKNHNMRVISTMSNLGSTTTVNAGGSDVASSFQQNSTRENRHDRHDRHGSYDNYTDVSLQSPERGSQRAYKGRSRAAPSQYLESMFEDN